MRYSVALFFSVTSVAALAVSVTGCGASESETIGSIQAAFSEASCAEADADKTFAGKVDPAVVSPRAYNTCYKGYVVDIENLDPNYTGEGDVDAKIGVAYADTPITNKATCEGTKLTAVFYRLSGSSNGTVNGGPGGWITLKTAEQRGEWFLNTCYMGVELTNLLADFTYRVAATVRTPSNATRKLSIRTYKPVVIR